MNTADIKLQVFHFINKTVHLENPVEINSSTTFADLSLDSLDVAQLLFEAEDAFGISFDQEKGFIRQGNNSGGKCALPCNRSRAIYWLEVGLGPI